MLVILLPPVMGSHGSFCVLQANAEKEDDEMADGVTMEDVQTEAAAKQRAFESHQAEASTSGRGTGTGTHDSQYSRPCVL